MMALTKSPLERIPLIGRTIIFTMMFVGLMGGFLTSPGTTAYQAFSLLLEGALLVILGSMFVHPVLPTWKWVSRPKDQMALTWLYRISFILFGVYFVRTAYELIGSLVTS